ncbi:MAG: tRNA (adenosine(37)-N6)-threonylcarbamoyltransferase complex transferase subunit TsaD [Acidobacteriota bacterium]
MFVLGIESSCDETAVSLVERGKRDRIIDEKIKSQIPLHKKYGGIVPEIASRSHLEVIDNLTYDLLQDADKTINDIGLIAVTQGPGLIGSLLIGLAFAKGLSFSNNIPLVGVDHIHAHIESPFITNMNSIEYPLVALVVSGGHTSIFYLRSKFDITLFASTRDDAVGEVMDKVSKFMGLGYPGGPVLDRLYEKGDKNRYNFTFPRMSDGSDDFSFSGYKAAVLRTYRSGSIKNESDDFYGLISSFLNSVTDYLILKLDDAVKRYDPKSIIVAGGVSRNSLLRKKLSGSFGPKNIDVFFPADKYCTDNASMVGWLGYELFSFYPENNYFDKKINSYSRSRFIT